jgi:hypothetical protein
MGAMSNDLRRLAYFVGFYKAIQSAGAVRLRLISPNRSRSRLPADFYLNL